MPTFEIPDGPTSIEAPRSGSAPAEAMATYSVTNTNPSTMDGRLGVRVSGASKDEWFTIDGNRERSFDGNETQTATVRVRFPPDTPAGEYPFRLRAIAVNDPDNDHAEGPMTVAKLGPGGGGKKSLLWLWILLGLLAVAVTGGAAYYLSNRHVEVATKAAPPPPAALDDAQALRLAEKKTAAWFSALSKKDLNALVSLSPPPFYFDQGVLIDESQIRSKYGEILFNDRPAQEIKIDKMMSYTIGNLRRDKPEYLQGDRILNAMKLGDQDIAVIVMFAGGEGAIYFFRRSPKDVDMAGFWD
ncbi:MAG TPA: hypothetical protein VE989_08310 [Sphingomicrobium sp.]|nr:hypothetical protein [Sphingomicrobium sp.]